MNVTIRPLKPADLDVLFDDRSRALGADWVERQHQSEIYVAVAELEGVPVGRVGVDFVRRAGEGAAHVWSAHVEPTHQSRGIGTALMIHLEEVARSRGAELIMLGVAKDNDGARRLYERLGYHVCGEEVNSWTFPDGTEVSDDCWTMEKRLRETQP